jgi:histidinol-phosphate/aromatic aminotransferase/cobyric acid decarboxylase-like protein
LPAAPGSPHARRPARNAHVLVMRTLSKFGLAGVRLGYLLAPRR